MRHWIEIKATLERAPEDWSALADTFDRHGCPGSLQTDEPPTISAFLVDVEGTEARVHALTEDLMSQGVRSVDTRIVPEEAWAEDWKQHFKPRRIGRRLLIRPTWEAAEPAPGDVEIVLDPGQAFGTGDHPTTRLCLELLENANPAGKMVADVGCGSGILSIAACLLGAEKVSAVDIDDLSIEVAKENRALNGVDFKCFVGDGFASLEPDTGWDIVLSNIISATLIRVAPDARNAVHTGGLWIVSGIIRGNWPDVLAAAEASGFALAEQREEGEWVAAVFQG